MPSRTYSCSTVGQPTQMNSLFLHCKLKMSTRVFFIEQQQHPPTIEGIFGKDWCSDLWREERVATERKERMDTSTTREVLPQVLNYHIIGPFIALM